MRRVAQFAAGVAVLGLALAPVGTAAASTTYGKVAGQVGYEGGAYPGGFHPTTGSVKIVRSGSTRIVEVSNASTGFTVKLNAGTYTLIGCAQPKGVQCASSNLWQKVSVKAGHTKHVQLVTFLAP